MLNSTLFQSTLFKAIRQRMRDAGTLKQLCFRAESLANAEGQREPGAEHFVLAALELPDGTAQQAFAALDISAGQFRAAIAEQYRSALAHVGIHADGIDELDDDGPSLPTARGPYRTQPSAQALMAVLTRDVMKPAQARDATTPLLGAHVLLAAGAAKRGVVPRSFASLGITLESLASAARLALEGKEAR